MDRLESAIQAAKDGDNETARGLLREILEEDADNERAWLWLSQVADNDAERRLCLQQVLRINPRHTGAQRGLAHLGSPVPAEEELAEAPLPPIPPALTMRSVREAGRFPEPVAKPAIESPKAPARMPPAVATRRSEPRRPRLLPILLGIAGVLAVVLVVFIVTTGLEGRLPGTDIAAEPTLPIRIVVEATAPPPTAEPPATSQPAQSAPTPVQTQPSEPVETPMQPEPTQTPSPPSPTSTPSGRSVATSSKSDAAGMGVVALHDGTTAEYQVVSSAGKPVAGSDIMAVSDAAGLTLIAVAPGYRPYLATWESEESSVTSTARAPSTSRAPITIVLAPETELYMDESSVSLDGLLSLSDQVPGWESSEQPAAEVCAVLGSSGQAHRTLLALAATPLGPHFKMGFGSAADAEAWCAQALPAPDLPGELTIIRSDEADMTLAVWNPGGDGIVYGRVVGEDAQGIAGVNVDVDETGASATTLSQGWYILPAHETVTLTLSAETGDLSGGPLRLGARQGAVVQAPPLEMVRAVVALTEMPSPVEALARYWDLINEGRFSDAWVLLSPRFQAERFGSSARGFREHYADMALCRVAARDLRLLEEGVDSAVVAARMLYETGNRCERDLFDFDFHFVFDAANAVWLLDDTVWKGVSR